MQIPLEFDIWLQLSYEQFNKAENNMKEKNLNSFIANILKQYLRHPTHSLDHVTYNNNHIYIMPFPKGPKAL